MSYSSEDLGNGKTRISFEIDTEVMQKLEKVLKVFNQKYIPKKTTEGMLVEAIEQRVGSWLYWLTKQNLG